MESKNLKHAPLGIPLLAWLLTLGSCVFLDPLHGRTEATSLADVPLEDLAQLPIASVTGASKYEQSIQHAPASITVFSAEDFSNYGWQTLSDALKAAPGIHIRSDRFYDYIGNRGFTRPFDYNSRTLVLINGHRLNDPIYQQGSIGTDFLLDPELISRVEVIQGPGSSVYGSSSFFGVINVIPKRGADFAGGQVSVTMDDQTGVKGRVTVGNHLPSGLEYLFSVSGTELQGETLFPLSDQWRHDTELPDRFARNHDGTATRNLYFNARWSSLEVEAAYGKRNKQVLPEVYMTATADPSEGIDERLYALARYTASPLDEGKLIASLSYDQYNYDGQFSPAFEKLAVQYPYARSEWVNAEVRWQQDLPGGHKLLLGGEEQQNLQLRLGRINTKTGKDDTRIRRTSHFESAFAQVDWNLGGQFGASTGARLDSNNEQPSRVSPRLALFWTPDPGTHAKAIFGESFRTPNLEERYTSEVGNVQNPNLGAETNQGWELSLEQQLGETWSIEASGYRTVAKGLIQAISLPASAPQDEVFMNTNSQRLVTEGVSLGANAYFKSNVQVRLSYTEQKTKDDVNGGDVYDAPDRLIKILASAPLGPKWLRLSGEALYVSSRVTSSDQVLAGYWTGNVTLRAAHLWHRWDASLSVQNLADTRWEDPTNKYSIRSAPRTVFLRLSYDF